MSESEQHTVRTDWARISSMPPPGNLGEPDFSPHIVERVLTNLVRFSVIPEVHNSLLPYLRKRIRNEDDKEFQSLLLHGDYASCTAFIQKRLDDNATFRKLCLGLMSNAARDLGDQWTRDELSFVDVTVALARMHLLLHDFSKSERANADPQRASVVLANAPTEQHAFGLSVVAKVFEFEGWSVTGGSSLQAGPELDELVANRSFDIAGISAATPENALALKPRIESLRNASSNPDIAIIVGGGGFAENPELFQKIGADDVAADANEAVIKARSLVGDRSQPSP